MNSGKSFLLFFQISLISCIIQLKIHLDIQHINLNILIYIYYHYSLDYVSICIICNLLRDKIKEYFEDILYLHNIIVITSYVMTYSLSDLYMKFVLNILTLLIILMKFCFVKWIFFYVNYMNIKLEMTSITYGNIIIFFNELLFYIIKYFYFIFTYMT